eukprot:COSAG02_NODE_17693_length_986_cov_4.611048_1_plen_219_part_00
MVPFLVQIVLARAPPARGRADHARTRARALRRGPLYRQTALRQMATTKQKRKARRFTPARGRARRAKPGASLRQTAHPDAWAWAVVTKSEVERLGPTQIEKVLAKEGKIVSRHWVRDCISRFLRFGHPQHKEFRETIVQVTVEERKWIKARVLEQPDVYLDVVVDAFQTRFKRTITEETVSKAMQTAGQPGDDTACPTATAALAVPRRPSPSPADPAR